MLRPDPTASSPGQALRRARFLAPVAALLPAFLLVMACGAPPPPAPDAREGASAPPAPSSTAPAATSAPRTPAHVMGFEGAAWLEREGRDQEERPEVVLAAMELKPGLKVAEIGAGTGYFSRRIGKEIGPTGKVYAVDIEPRMLELLKGYAAEAGVGNIETRTSEESDPKIEPGSVDRILLVDVYHEFQKPREMLAHIGKALAPGGRVILVEYRAEDDSAKHILAEHRMSVAQVLAEWTPAGFRLVRRLETLPSQHLFVFAFEPGAAGT